MPSYNNILRRCVRYQSIDQEGGYLNTPNEDNPLCSSCLFNGTRDCAIQNNSHQLEKEE
ncbi:hypothetical protein [Anaeropeptidivorans aminofermentans]|uniref:hypothetical protein n=1 Tax=Anaeropeptidivorans aminofermentans TaxID=2934315 RepID=UPI002023D12B|nr:hypothetical protein [Anaeropeptidivorans aminofermentans]